MKIQGRKHSYGQPCGRMLMYGQTCGVTRRILTIIPVGIIFLFIYFFAGHITNQEAVVRWKTKTESSSNSSKYVPCPTPQEVKTTHLIDSDTLRILFWTEWVKGNWWFLPNTSLVSCGGVKCQYTHDKSLENVSHALLFYIAPRTYYQQNKTLQSILPQTRNPKHYWIGHFSSSPVDGEFEGLDEMNSVLNLTNSHDHKAEMHTPFGYCQKSEHSEMLDTNYASGKTGLASWFVSHCKTINKRHEYVVELKKYITVNVYGKCKDKSLGSLGIRCESNKMYDRNCDDSRETMNSHKFYIAFENANCEDYITEKTFKILEPGMTTVPIIMSGVTNLEQILPPKSYIDVNSFTSPAELAKYLVLLDEDDDLYNEYFAWRATYTCVLSWIPCAFCRAFHKVYGHENTVTDIMRVYGKQGNCEER